jgi:hypothetical protein
VGIFLKVFHFIFVLVLVGFCASDLQARNYIRDDSRNFGPNFNQKVLLQAPFTHQGSFPKAEYVLHFDWLEPLGYERYSYPAGLDHKYLRYTGFAEMSPLYGHVGSGVGIRLMSYFDVTILYTNLLYFGSSIEMRPAGKEIKETWNSSYIRSQLYENSEVDQIQAFHFIYHLSFRAQRSQSDVDFIYTLLDVNTENKTSFDYSIGVPVSSREHLYTINFNHRTALGRSSYDLLLDSEFILTGKEDLINAMAELGLGWFWGGRESGQGQFASSLGFWARDDYTYTGELKDRFTLKIWFQKSHLFELYN